MQYPLVVSNLRKSYKFKGEAFEALKGVSFKVRKGEVFGLLGPNGAGKTTTINILTGILSADSGSVRFFGRDPGEATKNRINAATAYNMLNGILTVEQNLKVYAKMYDVANAKEKILDLLTRFGIFSSKDKRVYDLSSGQRTRVNICKALINSPEVVFLDEATAGLDPDIAATVRKEIKKLNTTIIFTSHIMSEVEELCDRIAFLDQGKLLKTDTPHGLKKLIKRDLCVIEFLSMPSHASRILEQLDVVSRKRNIVTIRVAQPKDVHKAIHTLITQGFEICDFHLAKPTLDDVFIKIARKEL